MVTYPATIRVTHLARASPRLPRHVLAANPPSAASRFFAPPALGYWAPSCSLCCSYPIAKKGPACIRPMSRRRAPQPTRNSGPDSQGVIVEFLGHVANAITNGDGNSIAQLLVVDPMAVCSNTIYFNALRPEVNQNADTVEQKVEQALTDDWPSLNEAVVSYLYYIASFQPDMMNPMNPGAVKMMLHSFEKMKDFMKYVFFMGGGIFADLIVVR